MPFRIAALLIATLPASTAVAADRPNFVFMIADDQRYDALSCVQKEQGNAGRFPWFRTPNMDRIAAEGVRFTNAFVVNALCSPSRACFLTGKYSHANGIWNNTTPFAETSVTHASLLRAAGYSTGYVGKWHMGTQAARPGFDWSASPTGQSKYFDPTFLINGKPTPQKGWQDDLAGDFAVQFLERERDKAKPFVLCVGFKAPHGPFEPPARLKNAFEGEKARKTPNFQVRPGFNPDKFKQPNVADGDLVNVNLNYFRCIAGVDENVGKILNALDRLKLADNTVVIYTSDNGFYLGEHGLGDKRSAYDESLRIPFLVRDPRGGKGATRADMVLNIDLAPTLLDLANVPVPQAMQGKSFRPQLSREAPAKPLRPSFLYTYFHEPGGKADAPNANPGGYNTPTLTAVRTPTHKLIRYVSHPEWTELFDLKADPYELKNRFADPAMAEVRAALESEHDRLTKALEYKIPAGVKTP
jgi:arylsulfatase A-like enzyme